MATIPLATMGPTVDANGISIPTYADILATLQDRYRGIYGSDAYLDSDSQDGQWLAIQAAAINDQNMSTVAAYNQFSPTTSKGAGLSSVVKINGIRRQSPSNSTVDVKIVGQTGTAIINGIVGDTLQQRWFLPASVNIPISGEINVTATAERPGAVAAGAGAVQNILTPTRGWQSVTNLVAATPGAPVETDAQLRIRQSKSVSISSITPMDGIVGAVSSIPGVSQVRPYENDTNVTDSDGIPGNSIALVVIGGNSAAIAQAISDKKNLGTGTFGNVSENIPDAYGNIKVIKFSRPSQITIKVDIEIEALDGYTSLIGDKIKVAVAAYITALKIGANVVSSRLYLPANLFGQPGSETYEINTLEAYEVGDPPSTVDIIIPFDDIAVSTPADINLTVV